MAPDQQNLEEIKIDVPELWEVVVVEKPRGKTRTPEVLASVPAIIAGAGERAAWRFLE